MPPAGFEPAISPSERPHPHILGRAANGIGCNKLLAMLQNLWANSCTLCILQAHDRKDKMSRTCKKWLRFLIPKPERLYTIVRILLNWILQKDQSVSLVTGIIFHKIEKKIQK